MNDKNNPVTTIVPFGKYKGKPLEILMQDASYVKWLTSQDWFQEKFSNMYTLVINNFNIEPVETPEHNAMQVKFLNKEYMIKLVYAIYGETIFQYNQDHLEKNIGNLLAPIHDRENLKNKLINELIKLDGSPFLRMSEAKFEVKGIDVVYEFEYGYGHIGVDDSLYYSNKNEIDKFWKYITFKNMRVELKPSIGDDFPQILRQIKSNRSNIIVFQEYHGQGASFDDFINYFKTQGIIIIKESTVTETKLPIFDETISISNLLK